MYQNLAVLALFAFAYSAVAGRLARTPVGGPIVYLAFGVLAGPVGLGLLDLRIEGETIRLIAELTLALVLFSDAAHADLRVLRRSVGLPERLLLAGLPLTILLGFAAGWLLFPELQWLEVALLATMLAPTDAALGKAVVTNPVVPASVREGLNVESGLNDGICVPILFTFLALATQHGADRSATGLALELVAGQIGLGAAVGVGLALAASWALRLAATRAWIVEPWVRIPVVALAFACFALAQSVGGSGFIACFVGGLVFGARTREHKEAVLAGAESLGETFALLTWVIFGEAVVLRLPLEYDWRVLLYAVLSLTAIRMLPVFVCVLGLRLPTDEKLFLGWFGPRGLATIVFGVVVAQARLPHNDVLIAAAVVTVVLSVLAHGLSANPLAAAFGARQRTST